MIPRDPDTVGQASLEPKFSLVIGGPFYRAVVRVGLAENPGPNIGRRFLILFLFTWTPLLGLTLAQGTAFGTKVRIPFLYDFSVYGRFWLGLSLLLIAEIVIDPWISRVVSMFASAGCVREDDLPAYCGTLRALARLRDSGWIELVLAILASLPFFLITGDQWVASPVSTWHGSISGGLSHAGWWFVLVSGPVLRFLMFRWFWRYVLWSFLLLNVAKLNLQVMPTHPDLLGGLGFVLDAQRQFGILFTALASVIAGQYANSITYLGAPISATEVPVVIFIVISIAIVLGPLTVFSPRLFEARRNGLARYGRLASRLSASFDSRWAKDANPRESLLDSGDSSSFIDYVSTYNVIREMRIIPVSKRLLIQVAVQSGAPFALVWLTVSPVERIVSTMLKLLL
jgi:hypothetical protein